MLEVSVRPRRARTAMPIVASKLFRDIVIEEAPPPDRHTRRFAPPPRLAKVDHAPSSIHRPTARDVAKYGGVDIAPVRLAGTDNSDRIENLRRKAIRCMPAGLVRKFAEQCGGDPNDPDTCAAGLRWITTGEPAAAIDVSVLATFTITITLDAALKPEMVAINDTPSESVFFTQIQYGTVNMGIGGSISGAMFSTLSELGGYWIHSSFWLYPGQKVKLIGTAIADVAANALIGMVSGFTDAPG